MFLGRFITEDQATAVHKMLNPAGTARTPSFYGTKPNQAHIKRGHAKIIDDKLVGAAEGFCEEGHPIYAEISAAMYDRLPNSVQQNLLLGQS